MAGWLVGGGESGEVVGFPCYLTLYRVCGWVGDTFPLGCYPSGWVLFPPWVLPRARVPLVEELSSFLVLVAVGVSPFRFGPGGTGIRGRR